MYKRQSMNKRQYTTPRKRKRRLTQKSKYKRQSLNKRHSNHEENQCTSPQSAKGRRETNTKQKHKQAPLCLEQSMYAIWKINDKQSLRWNATCETSRDKSMHVNPISKEKTRTNNRQTRNDIIWKSCLENQSTRLEKSVQAKQLRRLEKSILKQEHWLDKSWSNRTR